ncbi:MGMT family protein [Silvibacterium sp.]|uniref:MGMT family protein n=1 Tax=Silvibacterium sp. TaxID=1964179 RepID=UPI0039E69D63
MATRKAAAKTSKQTKSNAASGLKRPRAPFDQLAIQQAKRRLLRDASRPEELRDHAFRQMIFAIPAGKVSTYGKVAAAAGYPRYHRAVARLLRTELPDQLPWHRVLGAGGEVKLHGAAEMEQRARLRAEGVRFTGERVDMEQYEHIFRTWEIYS